MTLVGPRKSYFGPVASRTCAASAAAVGALPYNYVAAMIAPHDITTLSMGFGNWYVNASGVEVGTGDTLTVRGSVEWPASTFNSFSFSGSPVSVMANNTDLVSDVFTLPSKIPAGTVFKVYGLESPGAAGGMPYQSGGPFINASLGDAVEQTATNKTVTGGVVGNALGPSFVKRPLALLGNTFARTIALFGDSRQTGINDTQLTASGVSGEFLRSFGSTYATMCLARGGDKASFFVASHAHRLFWSQFASDIVWAYGDNDLNIGGGTAAQLEADTVTARALFAASQPFWLSTISPFSTGIGGTPFTDPTGADQAVTVANAQHVLFNAWARANGGGFNGTFDVCAFNELAPTNSGKWNAPLYTADGNHEGVAPNSAFPNSLLIGAFNSIFQPW